MVWSQHTCPSTQHVSPAPVSGLGTCQGRHPHAASARAQVARPDTRRSLAVPPHPAPSLGTVEETYSGRANVTWPDGSGYSVMMSLMR